MNRFERIITNQNFLLYIFILVMFVIPLLCHRYFTIDFDNPYALFSMLGILFIIIPLVGLYQNRIRLKHAEEPKHGRIYVNDGLNETHVYDFKRGFGGDRFGHINIVSANSVMPSSDIDISEEPESLDISEEPESYRYSGAKPTKIKIKPIDVINELETIPTPFNCELLDEKISLLKDKEKLINNSHTKHEVNGMVERLENRKKYTEYHNFFSQFQYTNQEKIDKLLSKYELVMETSDLFIPEFPKEAIEIIKKYTENVKAICDKVPVFYVIAEQKDFKERYKARDPILLAQSPFGFYYQILGAWDKELTLLSEL